MKLYTAYGSNLNVSQMTYRCPGATIYARGFIENYKIVFRGSKTGAYATIIPEKGSIVPVVVWEITSQDEQALDRYEGYPTFYYKKNIMVKLNPSESIETMAYIMFDEAKVGKPSLQYINTIADGYYDNNLDIQQLKNAIAYNKAEIEGSRTHHIAF